jgi:hypothetical protein
VHSKLSFSISYPDLIIFLTFADTTESGDVKVEEIGGEMEGDFPDNSNVYVNN